MDIYRQKIAKTMESDEYAFGVEDYPVFDMRRARRELREKWGPKENE